MSEANMKCLSDSLECYLSTEGQKQLLTLTKAGLDKDLAFEVLNLTVDESDLYSIPNPKEDTELPWIK